MLGYLPQPEQRKGVVPLKQFEFKTVTKGERVTVFAEDGACRIVCEEPGMMGGLTEMHLTMDELRLFLVMLAKLLPKPAAKPAAKPSEGTPPAENPPA